MSKDLDDKLIAFDREAPAAVEELLDFIEKNAAYLIVQARGRLIEGHWRYRDKLMYELTEDQLTAETSQEVADAINYLARRNELRR